MPERQVWIIQSRSTMSCDQSTASTCGINGAIAASHGWLAYSFRIRCSSDPNCTASSGAARRITGSSLPASSTR